VRQPPSHLPLAIIGTNERAGVGTRFVSAFPPRRIHRDGFTQSQEAVMRSKKKNANRAPVPIYRAIMVPPPPPSPPYSHSIARPAGQGTAQNHPGEAGKAAVTAAALHQLNRYAKEIQDFLETSRMDSLLDQIQSDLNPPRILHPRLRLRRD
jgi:hypothetical protein